MAEEKTRWTLEECKALPHRTEIYTVEFYDGENKHLRFERADVKPVFVDADSPMRWCELVNGYYEEYRVAKDEDGNYCKLATR